MPSFFHHLCKLSGCHEVPVTTNGRRYGLLPSASLNEKTTIEVDELDIVNRGNRGAVDELSEAN